MPSLVLNATTMNTGHCWQFTVSSLGETPFALHKEVDSVPRLRRAWYRPATGNDPGRRVTLGEAVAASAAVRGIFEPITLKGLYSDKGEPYDVRLVDGGVYDNQGSHGLLAHDCNVIIVSDAAGQLTADNNPPDSLLRATPVHAARAVSVLMERIRHAGFADLKARLQSKLLRGLMFVHMKAGLYVEPIGWTGSQESYTPPRQTILTPSGVRRDAQQALAELRTDLDDFIDEADYLMACGYQIATKSFEGSLTSIEGLAIECQKEEWEFDDALALITSTSEMSAQDRLTLLDQLDQGAKVNTG